MLTFDEPSHVYRWRGEVVPSVTQILSPLVNYAMVPPEALERARLLGQAVHRMTELHDLDDLDEDSLTPEMLPYLAGWKKFRVTRKEVAAHVALEVVKKHGSGAGKVLAGHLETARSAGKTKVTKKTVTPTEQPMPRPIYGDLLDTQRLDYLIDQKAIVFHGGKTMSGDLRKGSPVSANREKALFSHIFNFAREKGLTSNPNPCAGIKGNKEKGRDVYIDNAVFSAVWNAGDNPLRDAMDLAYLTGQRPADVLKFLHSHIVDDELNIQQNKRGKRLRIKVNGELAKVIQRINDRSPTGGHLIQDAAGQGLPSSTLRSAFQTAREAAIAANPEIADQIAAFQFRDLRAKAGTDKEETSGIEAAQDQLGHSNATMTARYVRHRRGKLVSPTK